MPRPAIVHAILARLRNLSLPQALLTLLGLMLVRGALQARITIGLEELRQRLLMADISSSVPALEQVTLALQAVLCLGLLDAGVLAVGRGATRAAANTAQRCPATGGGRWAARR